MMLAVGACPQLRGHELHVRVNVVKEVFVAGAEIVQAGFAVGRGEEPMFWAFPVAREPDIAFTAHARKRVQLVEAEILLLLGADHLLQIGLGDISDLVLGVDEMVAGIQVSGVFHRERRTACLAKYAQLASIPSQLSRATSNS